MNYHIRENTYTWANEYGETADIKAGSRATSSNIIGRFEPYKLRGNHLWLIRVNGKSVKGMAFWLFASYDRPGFGYWQHEFSTRKEAEAARREYKANGYICDPIWKEINK